MTRTPCYAACLALAAACLLAPTVSGQGKTFKFNREWAGSVADETLQKSVPEVVTSAKALENLWKTLKVEGEVPKIDFEKEIVVVATTRGSKINVSGKLNDKGDLQVLGLATLDLRPGFRYVIGTLPREGVKTVNKKELPKE